MIHDGDVFCLTDVVIDSTMATDVTSCNLNTWPGTPAAFRLEGKDYWTAASVARKLGVSRQTFWRWRRAGKIPPGCRYRDRQILYGAADAKAVYQFANRLEPLAPSGEAEHA